MTKDVISLSISVLLLFRHYISHKITLVPPAVAGYYAVLAVLLFALIWPLTFHWRALWVHVWNIKNMHINAKRKLWLL